MESKVNYALVGAFVLGLGAVLIGAVLWLAVGTQEKTYDLYRVYFSESVAGLNVKAAVKYRGVAVGEVADIALDPDNPERVEVNLRIERGTPIRTDTRAVLTTQGLTGLASIELTGTSRAAKPLTRQGDEPYPVIATGPSLVKRLDDALNKLLGDAGRLTDRLDRLLGDDNQAAFRELVTNLAQLSAALARNGDGVLDSSRATLDEARRAAQEITALGARAKKSLDGVDRTVAAFGDTARSLGATGRSVERVVLDTRREVQQFSGSVGPEVAALLAESRRLVEVIQRVGGELEREPRMLLFGKPSERPGPGE
ncbi:phospholipid/cholesterol/gamma-HCH transport system substrate-binding protein [Plasticicumulans lactativorans]|uniref:Phospholipid/cholesterol/gamma-HCH transport system substrate-binding protein n=1 Tax=Plasticicumulans lactativorans TaxID=1133106 RepID=A0A4R2LCU2_9GAMM|nr:MlaD family protein [Plasticicumulans lactativorans]TCO82329.1 phospholipid/cholesterol/gamma-HCH transport system substrate-binding protein [Plasticicumulans lactativorans]